MSVLIEKIRRTDNGLGMRLAKRNDRQLNKMRVTDERFGMIGIIPR